jgi:hypothetical protein
MKQFIVEYDEVAKSLSMSDSDGNKLTGLDDVNFSVGPDFDDMNYCDCDECCKDKPKPESKLFVTTNYNKKY